MKINDKLFQNATNINISEEMRAFEQDFSAAAAILKVTSQKACIAFINGASLETMRDELLETFTVSSSGRQAFADVVERMLSNTQESVRDHFVELSQRAKRRQGQKLNAYEWDALKTHAQAGLKEVATGVLQLWEAHSDKPVRESALRPGI